MKIVQNQKICNGCRFSSLHYCQKFNETCLSVRLNQERYQLICKSCNLNDSYEFGLPQTLTPISPIGKFRLPGLDNITIIESLVKMKECYPEVFYQNREISAVYDSFSGAIWNGRQANFQGKIYSVEELIDLRDYIESLGISLNLTWNNHLISGIDIYDKFCNIITEAFHNGKHSITVASLELFNYLKQTYPNYTYYQSAITASNDIDFIKHDNRFDYYVLNRTINNNWDKLLTIPKEERKSIELLCNDFCTPFCNRMVHYNLDNKLILNRSNPDDYIGKYCTIDHDFMYFNNERWDITILPQQIDDYISRGFYNFKLSSRGDLPPIMALKSIQYLVKPEYMMDSFVWAMNGITTSETIFKDLKSWERMFK